MAFEPTVERLGYKRTMYLVSVIQVIGIVSEFSGSDHLHAHRWVTMV